MKANEIAKTQMPKICVLDRRMQHLSKIYGICFDERTRWPKGIARNAGLCICGYSCDYNQVRPPQTGKVITDYDYNLYALPLAALNTRCRPSCMRLLRGEAGVPLR